MTSPFSFLLPAGLTRSFRRLFRHANAYPAKDKISQSVENNAFFERIRDTYAELCQRQLLGMAWIRPDEREIILAAALGDLFCVLFIENGTPDSLREEFRKCFRRSVRWLCGPNRQTHFGIGGSTHLRALNAIPAKDSPAPEDITTEIDIIFGELSQDDRKRLSCTLAAMNRVVENDSCPSLARAVLETCIVQARSDDDLAEWIQQSCMALTEYQGKQSEPHDANPQAETSIQLLEDVARMVLSPQSTFLHEQLSAPDLTVRRPALARRLAGLSNIRNATLRKERLESVRQQLRRTLEEGDFTPDLLAEIVNAYVPTRNFRDAVRSRKSRLEQTLGSLPDPRKGA